MNFAINPDLLKPFVPPGTEIDYFQGKTFVSVVGLLHCKPLIRGKLPLPFHSYFEQVNLRFYVRRKDNGKSRQGVVFIKQLVPKVAVAWAARNLFNQNCFAVPMKHQFQGDTFSYEWIYQGERYRLYAGIKRNLKILNPSSIESFIGERYWGYAARKNGGTLEFRVEHPSWRYWEIKDIALRGDLTKLYGESFGEILSQPYYSAFVAEGSSVKLWKQTLSNRQARCSRWG